MQRDDIDLLRQHFMLTSALRYTPAVWVIAGFLALTVWPSSTGRWVLGWPLLIVLCYQARHVWLRPSLDLEVLTAKPDVWRRRFWISTVGCGLVVGAGPWWVFPGLSESGQMFVTLILLCWLAGSMASIGHDPRVFMQYAMAFAAGIGLGWLHTGSPYIWPVLGMLPLYVVVITGFSKGIAAVVDESLRIRLVNRDMVRALQVAKTEAEDANSAKSRFLAVASHDLRQPLHALSLLNGLLGRNQSPERTREISDQMSRSLQTLDHLFGTLLDFSKLEASTVEAQMRWVHLPQLLERVANEFRMAASAKGLALDWRSPPVDIHTDPDLLERVLRNLLENALKFTERGGIRMDVHAQETGAPGDMVIVVSDSGQGIPANLHQDVFKEYFQAAGSKAHAGLGLGLAIVKRLTAILHMDVQLHDNRPQGSRFELHVPASMVREGDSHSAPIPLETPFQLSLEGLAVLCVDDDPSSLAALVNLVSDWGCTVIAAQSPEDAIAKCRRRTSIDVVLSDYALGGTMTGEQLIHVLRRILGEVPGALLTGDPEAIRRHRAGQIEFPVLVKPVPAPQLRSLLEVFVGLDDG